MVSSLLFNGSQNAVTLHISSVLRANQKENKLKLANISAIIESNCNCLLRARSIVMRRCAPTLPGATAAAVPPTDPRESSTRHRSSQLETCIPRSAPVPRAPDRP